MPLLESILNLFRKKPKDTPTQTPSDIRVPPMAESTINSITFSPDMNTLYSIENGRAIPFSLKTKLGVVIGISNGQLTASVALPDVVFPPVEDVPDTPDNPETPGDGETPEIHPAQHLVRRPIPRPLRLSTSTYHWNFLFVKEKAILSIIGATDIDSSIIGATDIDSSIIGATDIDSSLTAEREIIGATDIDSSITPRSLDEKKEATCRIFSFSLDAGKTVRINKVKQVLNIYL